ncbi:MAG: phytanoyl-CoA dioxygenase family protein [Gammaproteobacteria bacterium]|nr:phytanoyl-CoA dioxygenase family protein [Gammaproteobacteria bacterium]
MRDHVTPEEVAFYRESGFVILRGFYTPDEIEAWRTQVWSAVEQRGDARILDGKPTANESTDFYANVFLQRVNLWEDHAGLRGLMLDQRFGKIAADLEGVDGMRIWHDQALIKHPWANQTSFHLDVCYWSFSSRHATSIWMALDDITPRNGCLYFLPGSHKTARFENVGIGPNMNALLTVYPDWSNIEPYCAEMKAGDVSFHNGLTAHAAGPNMTPRLRRAMSCGFMPDGARFNGTRNVLREDYFNSLTLGDELHNDHQNPLLYSRTKSNSIERSKAAAASGSFL